MSIRGLKTSPDVSGVNASQKTSERLFTGLVVVSLALHLVGFVVLMHYERRPAGSPPRLIMVDMASIPEPKVEKALPPVPEPVRVKPRPLSKTAVPPPPRPTATPSATPRQTVAVPIAPLGAAAESRLPAQKSEMAVPVAPVAPHRMVEHPPATPKVVSAPVSPAPSADAAEKLAKARSSYRALIAGLIDKNKEYPLFARKAGHQGTCYVRCTLTCAGDITRVEMVKSSGHDSLDKAALRAVQSVGKFPPPPTGGQCTEVTFEVPISFRLS